MKKIVIASACRTAIGKFGGTLANVPAVELGSIVIKEALNRANVAPEQVDHVYMGCVIQAGLGQNVARQAALKAGLPIETPAVTVNVVCGSGLNCVNMAAQMIRLAMLTSWSQAAWRTWTWLPSHCRRLVTATAWALLWARARSWIPWSTMLCGMPAASTSTWA